MHSPSPLVIAIDGPAGSGKSTIAKLLAQRLNLTLLDTGAIYRTIALLAVERRIDWKNEAQLAEIAQNLEISFRLDENNNRVLVGARDVSTEIRQPQISQGASAVSALPAVRQALLDLQRRFAQVGGVVAEGRDIGTVVFPQASLKIFLTAQPQVRAQRRWAELKAAGHQVELSQVLEEQQARDQADSGRKVAPLKAATDAIFVDTSHLTIEQIVEKIISLAQEKSGA